MARALALAERGAWSTRPNPRVGCVIVDAQQQVIGQGWHQRAGQPHAEVFALRQAGAAARGATAYVTLEPCAHVGRTPPCADALIAAGIARVVVASGDPFTQVAGRGIERLRAAGIEVHSGVLFEAARALNVGFFSRIERQRPWVRVKLAASLDGRSALADGSSQWITGQEARADGHRWRARACAVLSGIGTVLADDPQLSARPPESDPVAPQLRVVVDSSQRVPQDARLFQSPGEVVIAHAQPVSPSRSDDHGTRLSLPDQAGRVDLAALLHWLAEQRQVNEVHVEAGPTLAGALLTAGLADELLLYQAATVLGNAAQPVLKFKSPMYLDNRQRLRWFDLAMVGDDVRLRAYCELQVQART